MLEHPIKILHTADIQIEVRGQNQRRDEFEFILREIEDVINKEEPDVLIWAGDIFEHHRANDIERGLFIEHLHRVLDNHPSVKEIVITDGNHDIDQQTASNFYVSHGSEEHAPNALATIVDAINDNRILYMNDSTIYRSHVYDLVYYNWAQRVKHSSVLDADYNPTLNATNWPVNGGTSVTIFHDPIQGARMWDDKEMRNSDKHNPLDVFCTRSIFAGDIHIPQVIETSEKTFIYCGSPVPRNFGEGDYVVDSRIKQRGMNRHCISVCKLQPDGTISDQEFIPIKQYRSYTTFEITPAITKPSDELWEIPYPTFENVVKVKLPAATETYLKQEPEIIDAIHAQNFQLQNISVIFTYGRALTAEVDDVISTQDIHQLISEHEITRVADEYIRKQVSDSRAIPTEDKEKCIKLVTELFTRELKNYISNIPSNNIHLQKAVINNFMAFGGNVEVDMKSPDGLIKLTGGNGVGKTTFYNAIKWCTTGYISLAQNRKLKNENNLLVFNDYMWDVDKVLVELSFIINSELIKITRTATRSWKKGTTEEQKKSKNWKNYVQTTDSSIEVSNLATGETKTGEPAEQILSTIFYGLENLSHTVFPSQFTLRSVICTEPARLCEEILRNIGMSFFDKMYDKYDDVRNNIMSKIAKPSSSVEAIMSKISDYEKLVSEHVAAQHEAEAERNTHQKVVDALIAEVGEKKLKIDPSANLQELESREQQISELEESIKSRKEVADERKKICEVYVNSMNFEKIESELPQKEEIILDVRQNIEISHSEEKKLVTQKSELEKKIADRKLEIQSEFSERRKAETNKLDTHHNNILRHQSDISAFITKRNAAIQDVTERITSAINQQVLAQQKAESEYRELHNKSVELTAKIEQLEKSTVCPTCNRPFDEHTVDHINAEKNKLIEQLSEIDVLLESKLSEEEQIANKLAETKKKLEMFKSAPDIVKAVKQYSELIQQSEEAISNVKKEIESIKSVIAQIDEESSSVDDMNINSWKADISNIESQIADIVEQRTQWEFEVTEFTEILKNLKDSINEYHRCKKELDELKITYNELDTASAEVSRLRGECTRILGTIKENQTLMQEIENLNTRINTENSEIAECNSKITRLVTQIAVINEKIADEKTNKINAIKYRIVEASLKQYKTLIGKNGLPQHIFSIIREVLNSKLNDLLEDMDFRLMFDNSNQLIMVDLSKPGHPIRKPSQLSGMQTCFTGLALVYVNRMCNNTFIFDHLFIDEVSGQLNSGEELTYGSMNYQEQLKKLLRKFTNLKVWIVDHVIDDLGEDYRFEVVPSNNGSVIKPLSKI